MCMRLSRKFPRNAPSIPADDIVFRTLRPRVRETVFRPKTLSSSLQKDTIYAENILPTQILISFRAHLKVAELN